MSTPTQQSIEHTILSLPSELTAASTSLAQQLVPAANDLLLLFAAISLAWLGIRIMMEKNLSDQILLGDALKLLMLISMAKAILLNHSYLVDVLQQSIDYLVNRIGAGDSLKLFTDNFVIKPTKAVYDAIGTTPKPEAPDSVIGTILHTVKSFGVDMLNFFGADLWLMMIAVAVAYLGILAGITTAIIVAISGILFIIVAALGVICVPFLVLPKLDKIFWSWVDGLFYTLAVKLTVAGTVVIVSALNFTIPSLVTVSADGLKVINYAAVFNIVIYAVLAVTLLRLSYAIAGMIAGARFSLRPDTSVKL